MGAHKLVTPLATPQRSTPSVHLAPCLLVSNPTIRSPRQLAWNKGWPLAATRSQLPRGRNFTTPSTKCGWRRASVVTKDATIILSLGVQSHKVFLHPQTHFPSTSYSHTVAFPLCNSDFVRLQTVEEMLQTWFSVPVFHVLTQGSLHFVSYCICVRQIQVYCTSTTAATGKTSDLSLCNFMMVQ